MNLYIFMVSDVIKIPLYGTYMAGPSDTITD